MFSHVADGQERPIAGDASAYGVEAVFFNVADDRSVL